MNPNPQPASDYASRAREETLRRDQLNQSLKLLRRVREAALAGDPIPTIEELMAMTGLLPTATDDPLTAVESLIEAATAEREASNRRIKLAKALSDASRGRPAATSAPAAAAPSPSSPQPVARSNVEGSPLVDEADRLAKISARDLDSLPYGAILLDESGRILSYNDTESRMARLPIEAVLGRNFFTEVAPCTRVKEFEGRFRALASGQGLPVVSFDFIFPFPFGAQRVAVLLTRGANPGTVIMALLRR
ncbi:MAG: PAS domain-containing protein [Deltaproteobacteria bacterium]|nr:PAS domain-containing protein [Deltaproteobacteria bacterium]